MAEATNSIAFIAAVLMLGSDVYAPFFPSYCLFSLTEMNTSICLDMQYVSSCCDQRLCTDSKPAGKPSHREDGWKFLTNSSAWTFVKILEIYWNIIIQHQFYSEPMVKIGSGCVIFRQMLSQQQAYLDVLPSFIQLLWPSIVTFSSTCAKRAC